MNYTENIKGLRLASHMTQAEVANRLGVTASAYAMYERGEREPNIEIIQRMADIFKVDINYLLGYNSKISPTAQEFSDGELKLLQLFKEVPEDQQEMLLEMIEVALKNRR